MCVMHIDAMKQIDVKAIRTAHRLTQKGLADMMGVNLSTVWRWENGTPPRGPAVAFLRDLESRTPSPTPERESAA
ncbi:helix-turn-helix domain-containing protein [Nitratireductor rhodophyticola]|uniref:helix-turn-helix domain-containing protein n=1 Tax=Nitratireductor rhodophyticola TaxID=2854036 RepID=UPI003BA99AC0